MKKLIIILMVIFCTAISAQAEYIGKWRVTKNDSVKACFQKVNGVQFGAVGLRGTDSFRFIIEIDGYNIVPDGGLIIAKDVNDEYVHFRFPYHFEYYKGGIQIDSLKIGKKLIKTITECDYHFYVGFDIDTGETVLEKFSSYKFIEAMQAFIALQE